MPLQRLQWSTRVSRLLLSLLRHFRLVKTLTGSVQADLLLIIRHRLLDRLRDRIRDRFHAHSHVRFRVTFPSGDVRTFPLWWPLCISISAPNFLHRRQPCELIPNLILD